MDGFHFVDLIRFNTVRPKIGRFSSDSIHMQYWSIVMAGNCCDTATLPLITVHILGGQDVGHVSICSWKWGITAGTVTTLVVMQMDVTCIVVYPASLTPDWHIASWCMLNCRCWSANVSQTEQYLNHSVCMTAGNCCEVVTSCSLFWSLSMRWVDDTNRLAAEQQQRELPLTLLWWQ